MWKGIKDKFIDNWDVGAALILIVMAFINTYSHNYTDSLILSLFATVMMISNSIYRARKTQREYMAQQDAIIEILINHILEDEKRRKKD